MWLLSCLGCLSSSVGHCGGLAVGEEMSLLRVQHVRVMCCDDGGGWVGGCRGRTTKYVLL